MTVLLLLGHRHSELQMFLNKTSLVSIRIMLSTIVRQYQNFGGKSPTSGNFQLLAPMRLASKAEA